MFCDKKEGAEPSLFLTTIALAVVNRSTFWSDRERKRKGAQSLFAERINVYTDIFSQKNERINIYLYDFAII